jgi:hypothetical protein
MLDQVMADFVRIIKLLHVDMLGQVVSLFEVRPGFVTLCQLRSCYVRLSLAISGLVVLDQVTSCWDMSNQVKSGFVILCPVKSG